jgi:hypothetical protein
MAIDKGWDGNILLSTGGSTDYSSADIIAHITEWTLDAGADVLENTGFGDTYDRSYVAGLRGPNTFSFAGYAEAGNAAQSTAVHNWLSTSGPRKYDVVLLSQRTTGSMAGYFGEVVLTGVSKGAAVDGLQTISGNGQFVSGKLSTYSTN